MPQQIRDQHQIWKASFWEGSQNTNEMRGGGGGEGGGGERGNGETRRTFYTIIKKLGALEIRFTFFRGGVEKSFKIIFISLGLGQVL